MNKFLGSLHLNNHTRRFKARTARTFLKTLLKTEVWFVLKCIFDLESSVKLVKENQLELGRSFFRLPFYLRLTKKESAGLSKIMEN